MTLAWRSLVRLMEGSRRLVAVSVAISIAQSLLLVPIAFLIRHAFDVTIPEGDSAGLIWIGALMLALFLGSSGLALLNRWLSLRATKEAIRRLVAGVLAKLFALPRSYFDRTELGTLHATIVQDSERLDTMANALVSILLPSLVIGLALVATLVALAPVLAALLFCAVPLMILTGRTLAPKVRSVTRSWQRSSDRFSSQTQVALRSMTLTKLHGAERIELERRERQLAELAEAGRRMSWWHAVYSLQQWFISAAVGVIVLVFGGIAVSDGRMSLGDLISFYAVLGLLRSQLMSGSVSIPQVISGTESLARLERIADQRVGEPYRGERAIDFRGGMALKRVSFEYTPGEPVLRDLSLEIPPGEIVVLLGPNGAGKSTVISLLAGLYAPSRGEVLADGVPLSELDLPRLRRAMGVIVQDPLIFPATVRENIAFGQPDAGSAQLERAARRAGAHDFIEDLPGGYEARVGDDGVLLSGGQRQRLALARALLGEPVMLMLDEPTTHLDREGTEGLTRALTEDPGRPTILIVSHDPGVAGGGERIHYLLDGRLSDEPVWGHALGTELGVSGLPDPDRR